MNIKIITQDESSERFLALKTQLENKGYSFEVFQGVDVSSAVQNDGSIDESNVHAIRFSSRKSGLSKGQVGCTLAHINLWASVVESGESCIVLEDDASLTEDFNVQEIESSTFDLTMIYGSNVRAENYDPDTSPNGIYPIARNSYGGVATTAYAVTSEGAKKLMLSWACPVLRNSKIQQALEDSQSQLHEFVKEENGVEYVVVANKPIDVQFGFLFGTKNLKCGIVCPAQADHSGLVSTIANNDWWTQPKPEIVLTFEQKKQRALEAVAFEAEETKKRGIVIEGIMPNPITLGANVSDRDSFTGKITLMREAQLIQATPEDEEAFLNTPQYITELDGSVVVLPNVHTLRLVLLKYGELWEAMWRSFSIKKAAIANASTEEELDSALAMP